MDSSRFLDPAIDWPVWKKNKQCRRAGFQALGLALRSSVQRRADTEAPGLLSSYPSAAVWRTRAQAPTRGERRFAAPQKKPTRGGESSARDAAALDRLPPGNLAATLNLAKKQIHARQTSHTSTKLLRAANNEFAA